MFKKLNIFHSIGGLLFLGSIIFMIVGLILIGSWNVDNYGNGFRLIHDTSVGDILSFDKNSLKSVNNTILNGWNALKPIATVQAGIVFAVILCPIFAGLAILPTVFGFAKKTGKKARK